MPLPQREGGKQGRKRLVMVHDQADLNDSPQFLLTDARHWEGSRVIRVWSYRWPTEIFHECCKQVVGLEAAQVRTEEAVKRHFRLRSLAQSLLQRAPGGGRKSERFAFAEHNQQTIGQKLYTLTRETLGQLLQLVLVQVQWQRLGQLLGLRVNSLLENNWRVAGVKISSFSQQSSVERVDTIATKLTLLFP